MLQVEAHDVIEALDVLQRAREGGPVHLHPFPQVHHTLGHGGLVPALKQSSQLACNALRGWLEAGYPQGNPMLRPAIVSRSFSTARAKPPESEGELNAPFREIEIQCAADQATGFGIQVDLNQEKTGAC